MGNNIILQRLAPCPKCSQKGKAYMILEEGIDTDYNCWYGKIACKNCSYEMDVEEVLSTREDTIEDLVEKWNLKSRAYSDCRKMIHDLNRS